MSGDVTVPIEALVRRLKRDLREIDRLINLLAQVEAGYRFTNRLDEALLIIPDDLVAEIRAAIGMTPHPLPNGEQA